MDNEDLWEFLDYIRDDPYVLIPRTILRDNTNPLERYTDVELLQRIRFSRAVVKNVIMKLVYPNLNTEVDNRGLPIPPAIKLYIALRFFATGSYQRVCSDIVDVSQASVCRICTEVSEKLAHHLRTFIKFPDSVMDFRTLKRSFHGIAGFPGVIGCIDGTHIEIVSPGGTNAELFRNRKGWMSLNVQVVAGPNLKILDIVIRWPGSAHDSRIFNSSSVCMRLTNNSLTGILLGDSAYAQTSYLYTPMTNPISRAEQRYNSAHILTRNVVERTFGVWKSRFRCLAKSLQISLKHTTRVIAATAVLHNIAIETNQEIEESVAMDEVPNFAQSEAATVRGNAIRAAFIQRHF